MNNLPKFSDYHKIEDQYSIGGNSDFMKLKQGDNVIRIITQFEVMGIHQYKNTTGKFESHICIGKDNSCVYCEAKGKVTVKYLGWVIDIKDNVMKLLEFGHTIFKQLGQYQEDPDYTFEDIPDYNVKIVKTGQGLGTEYQVIASPKRYELTQEEQDKILKLKSIEEIIQSKKDKEMKFQQEYSEKPTSTEEEIPVVEKDENEDEINVKDIPF